MSEQLRQRSGPLGYEGIRELYYVLGRGSMAAPHFGACRLRLGVGWDEAADRLLVSWFSVRAIVD